jgi:hypothetical protein
MEFFLGVASLTPKLCLPMKKHLKKRRVSILPLEHRQCPTSIVWHYRPLEKVSVAVKLNPALAAPYVPIQQFLGKVDLTTRLLYTTEEAIHALNSPSVHQSFPRTPVLRYKK